MNNFYFLIIITFWQISAVDVESINVDFFTNSIGIIFIIFSQINVINLCITLMED